jgi:hypothetical protein
MTTRSQFFEQNKDFSPKSEPNRTINEPSANRQRTALKPELRLFAQSIPAADAPTNFQSVLTAPLMR